MLRATVQLPHQVVRMQLFVPSLCLNHLRFPRPKLTVLYRMCLCLTWLFAPFFYPSDGATRALQGMDVRGVGNQPKRAARKANALFFVAFMVVGNFFILNLFIGIILDNFSRNADDAQQVWSAATALLAAVGFRPLASRH